MYKTDLEARIFSENQQFEDLALELFHFQYQKNMLYRQFADLVGKSPHRVKQPEQIPFLPITLFKNHAIRTFSTDEQPELIFRSSATTGMQRSQHEIRKAALYEESLIRGFERQFGSPENYCILALLPGYLERQDSSLVYMVHHLMTKSQHPQNGFYLNQQIDLIRKLKELESQNQPTLLFGVTFALIDLAEHIDFPFQSTRILETGGMKGRGTEWPKPQLHEFLKKAFRTEEIISEYGMTELLSQAYAMQDGLFKCPSWMKIYVRDEYDPTVVRQSGRGALNIIDLANIYSCSFLATEDVGICQEDGSFQVLGRLEQSEMRGCSLLVL